MAKSPKYYPGDTKPWSDDRPFVKLHPQVTTPRKNMSSDVGEDVDLFEQRGQIAPKKATGNRSMTSRRMTGRR